jgi:hypothetical protein
VRISKRTVSVALLVAVVGGLVTALIISLGGGGNKASPSPSSSVNKEAAELITLLSHGRGVTFHARYRAVTAQSAASGESVLLDLWRRPPAEREDTTITVSGRTEKASGFLLKSGVVVCRQTSGTWTCREVSGVQTSTAETLVASITRQVAGRNVSARDDTIGGHKVRCFTLELDTGPGEICVTTDGIPVRISAGDSRFELTELTTSVSDAIFRLPAPVTSPSPSGGA